MFCTGPFVFNPANLSALPASSPFMKLASERDRVAHLLRRFGLGASEAELDYYSRDGLKSAIDKLLAPRPDAFDLSIERFGRDDKPTNLQGLQAWWLGTVLTTRNPLREKMAVFWHDHFATSASKVTAVPLMYHHLQRLRTHAVGNFRTFCHAMAKDAAMIFWLDNQFNVKGKPNENFAREVMELFTLGIGHYTEDDVQQAAKAFTGYSFQRPRRANPNEPRQMPSAEFVLRGPLHDDGPKKLFGKFGQFDGDDVIDLLCDNPQTARHLTTKIWEWFVYPEPSAAIIDKFSTVFRKADLEISSLIRAIAQSDEFYSDRAVRSVYKNPVDFTLPTLRQLGLGEQLRTTLAGNGEIRPAQARGVIGSLQQATKGMGMSLMYPPDVAGWDTGASWISSATMVERIGWADRLFGQKSATSRVAQVTYPAFGLFRDNPTPEGVVDKLVSVFDAPVTSSQRAVLLEAARKEAGSFATVRNANATAARVSRLIFGTPEFQFS